MRIYDVFLEQLPKIDLHGYDRESARVMVNDFIDEAIKMNYSRVVIIHGIGSGIVKDSVHQTLFKRKDILNLMKEKNTNGRKIREDRQSA